MTGGRVLLWSSNFKCLHEYPQQSTYLSILRVDFGGYTAFNNRSGLNWIRIKFELSEAAIGITMGAHTTEMGLA